MGPPTPVLPSSVSRAPGAPPHPRGSFLSFAIGVRGHSPSAEPPPSREDDFLPLRLTAGCRTLNAAIVVRIHEGERRCSSAEERRSHTAKVGCSNQPTGTNPCGSSVARTPECESGGRRFDSVPRDHFCAVHPGPGQRGHRQSMPRTASMDCGLASRRPGMTDLPRGCSSAEERRSPKPRQRGFDPCLPRQLPGRSRFSRPRAPR